MARLWYRQPAAVWEEALPLGNGRMGAMVYGKVWDEEIQLNEESMWYGGKVDRNNPDALENLPKIRSLLKTGQIQKAEQLMRVALSGTPESEHPYQSLGNLFFISGKLIFPVQTAGKRMACLRRHRMRSRII